MEINLRNSKRLLFLIKLLSGAVIYFLMRITYLEQNEGIFNLDSNSWFYLIFTTSMVFIIWELNDIYYRYFQKKYGKNLFVARNIIRYQLVVFGSTIIAVAISMYFLHFHISEWLGCNWELNPINLMIKDLFKSLFVALIFNITYLNIVFIRYKRSADLTEEKIKKESILFQYESLRNQIDPHFLFNSFSVLNTLIQTNTELATQFLNKLSELYRYVLDNKEKDIINVENELKCLDAYLFLMKIRHENCIYFSVNIDDDILKQKVPTMSLQMLIENAIKHNSFNEKNPLKIEITQEDDTYLVITNRLNSRKTSKISTGIGLKNIQNRYAHYTSNKVVIQKTETHFIVKIPLLN